MPDGDSTEEIVHGAGGVEMHGPKPSGTFHVAQESQSDSGVLYAQQVNVGPNRALGLRGLWGTLAQFGAVGAVIVAMFLSQRSESMSRDAFQTAVLQGYVEARKEDREERSADRERTLKLAENLVRLEDANRAQAVTMSQQAVAMERLAVAMERLKLSTKPPTPPKPSELEPAPMPRGCP